MATKNKKLPWIIIGAVILVLLILNANRTPSQETQNGGDAQISLVTTPNPPTLGKNLLTIHLQDASGNAVKDANVSFSINMTTMNMGSQTGVATAQGDGTYAAYGNFTMGGPWKITANATESEGTVVTKDFIVNIN